VIKLNKITVLNIAMVLAILLAFFYIREAYAAKPIFDEIRKANNALDCLMHMKNQSDNPMPTHNMNSSC
jgi:hypothetical protein